MKLPLDGVKVVDISHIGAGPYCTSFLGDFGADVIKIEVPGSKGDPTRGYDKAFPNADSSYYMGMNRSKRAITLDLKKPEAREIIEKMVRGADVFIENLRPGSVGRMQLDYETLAVINPRLVYCSISAFGQTGPLVHLPAMDILVQGRSGIMGITGERGKPPVRIGPPITDMIAAFLACYGITMALFAREKQGFGQKVEVSLLDATVASMPNYVTGFYATGQPDGPSGQGHPQIVPYQIFTAKDKYFIVACLTEGFWQNLCKALHLEHLMTDPRFVDIPARSKNREQLVPMLEEIFLQKDRSEWLELLMHADVPCGPVNTLHDVLYDEPQVQHNEMIVDVDHPVAGPMKLLGVPVKLSKTPGKIQRRPPLMGEHTEEVLQEFGYSRQEIADLREKGVV